MIRLLLVLALLASLPIGAVAQSSAEQEAASPFSVGAFAGAGRGPAGATTWGFTASYTPIPYVVLGLEYSGWGSGTGVACIQVWPESYACSVGGWALLAGLRLESPKAGVLRGYVEGLAGRFVRSPPNPSAEDVHSTALAGGAGMAVDIVSGLDLRLGGRYLRPHDDAYEALMGETLEYLVFTLGLEYRPPR
jgi:hypothetical protein